ncbi:collagenase [Streptomyces sp. UNOB3_S3]|uniref:collagenase n=1 Tax=Streptomyces sp. UNOB3_S3 TaxID=2871682 RepID=UPI001E5A68AE|nr:collagenase [Streptomyces sp. UNOB3_S3]MCC3776415.1 collagenase [Streptomyces sp. UNOB3_S3]
MRRSLLTTAIAVTLCATVVQTGHADSPTPAKPAAAATAAVRSDALTPNPFDEVTRLAKAPEPAIENLTAPRGLSGGSVPGPGTEKPKDGKAKGLARSAPHVTIGGTSVPCTVDGVSRLNPEQFADFLMDPAVTADGCLRDVLWTWDSRMTRVFSRENVRAVALRAERYGYWHDGKNTSHLLEMFTYLHAAAYHDFSHDEIDLSDAQTVEAVRRAVHYYGTGSHTFDATGTNGETLREAFFAASTPELRQHQLPLMKRALAMMDASHPETARSTAWGAAAWGALSVGYLGVYNRDPGFVAAVTADPAYRAALKAFAGHTHLKGTDNAWVARDAVNEYGRLGRIDALKGEVTSSLGGLLDTAVRTFGQGSEPWGKVVTWLNEYGACKQYGVCKTDIDRRLFPYTYTYDNGGIKVRTALDRATVDRLYYASKQVKAQYHRVLGTDRPLAGDTNSTLNIVLYASRSDYEIYHPLLTGMGTNNGGIYIENGATFYTYERRVPQDSTLTLEELFRHEYTHYLNGRWAVPGSFGEGPWYQNDRTTAMDEGTAEFFDGSTRGDGIRVRKSLVQGVINDTAGGKPRMTVDQLLHAEYDRDGFRFYNYAGTFFEYLWSERPSLLREMYGYLRANDVAGFDAWRGRMGRDGYVQRDYDAFLDKQIGKVKDLYVPATAFTPVNRLKDASASAVRSSFAAATGQSPDCKAAGSSDRPRFVCTGRITANLSNPGNTDLVFKDMSKTVDYFILDRTKAGANNFADMNCSFGKVDLWSDRAAGTADFSCEGPLRG